MKETPRHWKPLTEIGQGDFKPIHPELIRSTMQHYDIDEQAARDKINSEHAKARYFVNDIYQVSTTPDGPDGSCLHINIRRRDGAAIFDFRHMQQIKNEVAGPEREAIQRFPAESMLVDTNNKYHLWVLPEGKALRLGWMQRDVDYTENRDVPGMRQRPL